MIASLLLLGVFSMTLADLPSGSAPAALTFPHFPDRLHAYVWRNWQLVPADRMASVIGATREDVIRIGRSMGLQGPPRISQDQFRRAHVTIIRRNWHLLPYDQLLDLLGWNEEQMAYALREDDFLFVKLGNLKPRCERLTYVRPDEAARRRAAEIRATVKRYFPEGVGQLREPLFKFVKDLSSSMPAPNRVPPSDTEPRFCYSYFGLYGDPLSDPASDPYPAGLLARLAASGVNGVWLQGVLSKLAPFPWQPDVSAGYETRLANLRRIVARAKRYGIRVYLYLNEPRAMPLAFFERHPELKGVTEGDYATLCTSLPEVRESLAAAVETISRAVPDLGGYFTITASENLTNCWSHFGGAACPRCSKRSGAEVVAEVNATIMDGIRRSGTRQRLIAWDWGWPDDWVEPAVAGLPQEAAYMSVSEWGLPIRRGGVETTVGEYSLSAVGPGPRAKRNWGIARKRGLQTFAKMQAACTWELSAVPYIPAVRLTAEHAVNLRAAGLSGVMLGWTLGGYPSPNLDVVRHVFAGCDAAEALRLAASCRFGDRSASAVVSAWNVMSDAFTEFPFHIGVVYTAPLQMGPANLLYGAPTGYHATMSGIPYDDLASWRAVYPPDAFSDQLRRVAKGFAAGAELLREAAVRADVQHRSALESEARIAEACSAHFRSVAAQSEFVNLRDGSQPDRLERMRALLREEIGTAARMHTLQMADSRLGFEATNQYFYVPLDLVEKVINATWLLGRLDGD
jgi:hypothetical protein